MPKAIHAKKNKGGFLYRFWSTITNSYYTPEMTLEQMVRWRVEYELERIIDRFGANLKQSLETAHSQSLEDWDEVGEEWKENEPAFAVEDPEKYIGGTVDTFLQTYNFDRKKGEPSMVPVVIGGKKVRVKFTVELVDP